MNEKQGPIPKATNQKKLEHTYEVLENGDVKVIQEQIIEFIWAGRDFLTLNRSNVQLLENTRKLMSEEEMAKLKVQEESLVKEIEKFAPIIEKSEKLTAIAYEAMIRKGLSDSLKAAVNDKDVNENWWGGIWNSVKPDRKKEAVVSLTDEERTKFVRITSRLKRKRILK